MKTEQTTTAIFTLPSGIEVRITNADPRDVEWLSGIERAVAAERERCAKVCEAMTDAKEQARADLAATEALRRGSQRDKIDRLSHQGVVNLFNRTLERCAAAIRAG